MLLEEVIDGAGNDFLTWVIASSTFYTMSLVKHPENL